MEVGITRPDLEEQIKAIKEQQDENEKDRLKLFGALQTLEYMLGIVSQRERNIAHLEAFKQMEEERQKQAEIDAAKEPTGIDCPNCGTKQLLRKGECVNPLCFYRFFSDVQPEYASKELKETVHLAE